MSVQARAIVPKVREVDEALRAVRDLRTRVREVHPETCFFFMAGRHPMRFSKRKAQGREERCGILKVQFGAVVGEALAELRTAGCAVDDVFDAFAALWTARRIAKGEAIKCRRSPVEIVSACRWRSLRDRDGWR